MEEEIDMKDEIDYKLLWTALKDTVQYSPMLDDSVKSWLKFWMTELEHSEKKMK
jgi:hypothetical protein